MVLIAPPARARQAGPGLPVLRAGGSRSSPGSRSDTSPRCRARWPVPGPARRSPIIRSADADHPAGQPRPCRAVGAFLLAGQRVTDLHPGAFGERGLGHDVPWGPACAITCAPSPHCLAWSGGGHRCAVQARLRFMIAAGPRRGTGPGSPTYETGRTTGRSPPPCTRLYRRPGPPGHDPASRHAPSETAAPGVPARSARPRCHRRCGC